MEELNPLRRTRPKEWPSYPKWGRRVLRGVILQLHLLQKDGAPLLANASIRDYQGRKAGYVANAVEQALLFPDDMAELRNLKRREVFLSLKRYLGMVSLNLAF